MEFDVGRMSEL